MAVTRLVPGFGFVTDGATGVTRLVPGFGFVTDSPSGGTTITVDIVVAIEELLVLNDDELVPFSFTAKLVSDSLSPVGETSQLNADILAAIEERVSTLAAPRISFSFTSSLASDQVDPISWDGTTGSAGTLIGFLSGITYSSSSSVITVTIRSPIEIVGGFGVVSSTHAPLDFVAQVQPTTRAPFEILSSAFSVMNTIPIEVLSSAQITQRLLVAIGATVTGSASGTLEYLESINATTRVLVEWTGIPVFPFVLDPKYHLKALKKVTSLKAPIGPSRSS